MSLRSGFPRAGFACFIALASSLVACAGVDAREPADLAAVPAAEPDGVESSLESANVQVAEARRATVRGARIVQRTATARVLELFDARGRTVATYYPGFFSAVQLVPDVAGNTGELIAQRNRGTYFLAAVINPRTGVVAVAVRSFIYAETSFDMVFRLNTWSSVFAESPYGPMVASLVPFDGREGGVVATATDVTRPFVDVDLGGLSYDAAGRLVVRTSDASGGLGTIVYHPDLTAISCTFVGGEGRRCPTGT